VSATSVPGTPNVTTIVFDQELYPFTLDHSRWSGRLNDLAQDSVGAVAGGKNVVWQSTNAGADVGGDRFSYDDAAQDLRNRFGELAVLDINNFPIS
jgi:hypothetical protein